VQAALGHDSSLAGEQVMGLDHRQALLDQPHFELVVVGPQGRPAGPVAVGTMGTHPLADLAHQLVAQLVLAPVTD